MYDLDSKNLWNLFKTRTHTLTLITFQRLCTCNQAGSDASGQLHHIQRKIQSKKMTAEWVRLRENMKLRSLWGLELRLYFNPSVFQIIRLFWVDLSWTKCRHRKLEPIVRGSIFMKISCILHVWLNMVFKFCKLFFFRPDHHVTFPQN